MGLAHMRTPYRRGRLDREDLPEEPLRGLQDWLAHATAAGQREPNAMALASADASGRPSVRMVLLKGIAQDGLDFFTNRESRKGRELDANPVASVAFWWDLVERQVRVEGRVRPLSEAESEAYFRTRPYGSRLGAWASRQGEPIEDRGTLERRLARLARRWPEGSDVPKPPYWGGYRLLPDRFEFWQGREDRLHDRFAYERTEEGWLVRRLSP